MNYARKAPVTNDTGDIKTKSAPVSMVAGIDALGIKRGHVSRVL